jgi:hypothetical protein
VRFPTIRITLLVVLLCGCASSAPTLAPQGAEGVQYQGSTAVLAHFEPLESWNGGEIANQYVHEGRYALRLAAGASDLRYAERPLHGNLAGDGEMSLWVHADRPENIGRMYIAFRSGNKGNAFSAVPVHRTRSGLESRRHLAVRILLGAVAGRFNWSRREHRGSQARDERQRARDRGHRRSHVRPARHGAACTAHHARQRRRPVEHARHDRLDDQQSGDEPRRLRHDDALRQHRARRRVRDDARAEARHARAGHALSLPHRGGGSRGQACVTAAISR